MLISIKTKPKEIAMTYINNITKEKKFKHLNYEQRKIIEKLLEEKRNRNSEAFRNFPFSFI